MPRTRLLDFTKIRHATSFIDVLAHYDLTPEKVGTKQVKIHCPFHDDQTPSCSINLKRGIFNCFGCPAEGNVLEFIAQKEGFTGNATFAAAKLALEIMGADPADFRKDGQGATTPQNARRASSKPEMTGTTGQGPKTRQRAKSGPSEPTVEAKEVTANPVIDLKLVLDPKHPFLESRGVTVETATAFGLGYATRGIMRKRIAIPIHNAAGDLVGYTGRWAGDDVPTDEPRYKLPKDFHKSCELFNLHRAAAMNKRFVVVVEGVWSVLRLHAAGIPTVALLGTSCSDVQAQLLANAGFRYAVVILDGDDGGRESTPAVVHTLSQHVYVKTIVLPDGEKPDTMDEVLVSRLCR